MNLNGKLKGIFTLLLVLAALWATGATVFFLKNSGVRFSTMNELKNISFRTSGKITEEWVISTLGIEKGVDLFALDIADMEKRLMAFPQIRRVFMEKRYPDTFFIGIDERVPLLKIAAKVNGEKQFLLVDELDGKIFQPLCYGRDDFSGILAANLELKLSDAKKMAFFPVPGIGAVKKLVDALRNDFRDIFNLVTVVDLRNYDGRLEAAWATIELHLRNGIYVVLGLKNFDVQLLRLDYLMNDKCRNDMHRIRSINISSPNDVVIGYK
ncbi:MAG: FtsQ-type POTRA domain-containing protein [Puniceicoccales bacterium]|jgi:cell division septal protein FtsQ|nr:FtsQ-type POTRA domain-containing protein [Puniceicoccales bacterium]